LKIGITLPQEWEKSQIDPVEAYETMTHTAQEAEALGFHSVWLFDHLHTMNLAQLTERMVFECWSSTAALARDTTSIRIGQMVTCNGFRNPALLAKMASTVDVLSHGRLDFGIGAGWYEQEALAYGYPFPDTATRLRQLREALQIIKMMGTEEEAYFTGKQYQLQGAINQPKGVQKPHIPILIGGKGEKVTLKLVAHYGDACNFTHLTPEELEQKWSLIRQYCEEIGRDYHEIRRTIFVNGFIGETEGEAIAKTASIAGRFSQDEIRIRGLLGTPEMVQQRLTELEQMGVQEVIVSLRDGAHLEALRLLAQSFS
jgi:F420-dependent oxidoreductase-like protein